MPQACMGVWQDNLDYAAFVQGFLLLLIALAVQRIGVDWRGAQADRQAREGVRRRWILAALAHVCQAWLLVAGRAGAAEAFVHLSRMLCVAVCSWAILDSARLLLGSRSVGGAVVTGLAVAALTDGAVGIHRTPLGQFASLGYGCLVPAAITLCFALRRAHARVGGLPRGSGALLPLAAGVPMTYVLGSHVDRHWVGDVLLVALAVAALVADLALVCLFTREVASRIEQGELLRLHGGRRRVLALLAGPVVLVLILAAPAMHTAEQRQHAVQGARLVHDAQTVAALIDGAALSRVCPEPRQQASEDYRRVKAQLSAFQRVHNDLAFVYTLRPVDDQAVVLVDATPTLSYDFSPCGQVCPCTSAELCGALAGGTPTIERRASVDAWGILVSAYAPVRGADGSLAGIVGVDIDTAQWAAGVARARFSALAAALVVCLLLLALGISAYTAAREKCALAMHRRFLEAVDAAVAIANPDFAIVYANSAAADLRAESPESGHDGASALFGGAIRHLLQRRNEPCRGARGRLDYELALRHGGGTPCWQHVVLSAVHDEQGRIAGYIATGFNVTERKRLEQAVRESEARLETILNTVKAGILVVDAETHRVLDINPRALEMIGCARGAIVGEACHKHVCPAEVGHCPVTDLGQEVDDSERTLRTADGRLLPIIKSVVPATVNGRQCLIECFLDIGEQKRLEATLRASETDLRSANEKLGRLLQEQYALADKLGEKERQLARIARTDQLTGLYNRRAFDELAEEAIRQAHARRQPVALAIADVDHFKRINDTFGHQIGDAVLSRVAEIIRHSFRGADLVCRYGGEEFVVVMPGTGPDECFEACERARAAVQERTSLSSADPSLLPATTITIGLAAYPEHGTSLASLVAAADAALYVGKHLGRNRVSACNSRAEARRAG